MGLPQEDDTSVYEDYTACIEWGNHIIGGRERAKHIDISKHFALAHEVIQNRHMRLIRVPTDKQLADIFTKALPFPQFGRCLMGLMSGDLKLQQSLAGYALELNRVRGYRCHMTQYVEN